MRRAINDFWQGIKDRWNNPNYLMSNFISAVLGAVVNMSYQALFERATNPFMDPSHEATNFLETSDDCSLIEIFPKEKQWFCGNRTEELIEEANNLFQNIKNLNDEISGSFSDALLSVLSAAMLGDFVGLGFALILNESPLLRDRRNENQRDILASIDFASERGPRLNEVRIEYQHSQTNEEKLTEAGLENLGIPIQFKCPIYHMIMTDPVSTSNNKVYERKAIEQHIQNSKSKSNPILCPLTRQPIEQEVTPCDKLRKKIDCFVGLAVSKHSEYLEAVSKNVHSLFYSQYEFDGMQPRASSDAPSTSSTSRKRGLVRSASATTFSI